MCPLYVVVAKFHGYGIIWHEERHTQGQSLYAMNRV